MTDDERAELDALRAENQRLKAVRVDGGLSKLAASAQRERSARTTLLAGGDVAAPELYEVSMEAAKLVMRDMGF